MTDATLFVGIVGREDGVLRVKVGIRTTDGEEHGVVVDAKTARVFEKAAGYAAKILEEEAVAAEATPEKKAVVLQMHRRQRCQVGGCERFAVDSGPHGDWCEVHGSPRSV